MGNHLTAQVRLEHEVYYPGNVVRGEAIVHVGQHEPVKCVAARIMCWGAERCFAITSGGEDSFTHNVHNDTVFYKDTLTLFGHSVKDHDDTAVEIPPGTYTYPFAFELPTTAFASLHTASCQCGGAQIKYEVVAFVKYDAHRNDAVRRAFTVVVPISKRDMLASAPVNATATATVTKFSVVMAKSDVTVTLPRSIYAAGETIEGEIAIDNRQGETDVSTVRIALSYRCEVAIVAKKSMTAGAHERPEPPKDAESHFVIRDSPVVVLELPMVVEHGRQAAAPFAVPLPHAMPAVSYPARGQHLAVAHVMRFDVHGAKIKIPIHIAHCADGNNRFAFRPLDAPVAPAELHDTEHAYTVPDDYIAMPCRSLEPPAGLEKQPRPHASAPQAVGTGELH